MREPETNENRPRGTYDFPFEFHHIDHTHPRYVMPCHWHIEFEIVRILSGSLSLTLDTRDFKARAGDIVFIHDGVLHTGIPEDCVYQCIVFELNPFMRISSVLSSYLSRLTRQEIRIFPLFRSDDDPGLCRTAGDIFDAIWHKEAGYELILIGQFYHFFGIIFRQHYYQENSPGTRRDSRRILQLKQAVEFIDRNYSHPLSLQEISAAASMSPKYFCRFFSEMTHQTPMDYLNRQRIEQACYQLATTDDSITEVAFDNGFNDLSYFIRTFKKYKGITPGRYKAHR